MMDDDLFYRESPLSPPCTLELKPEDLTLEKNTKVLRYSDSVLDSNASQSPSGLNLRLTVPKKHYSVQRNDSLQFMINPVFDKNMIRKNTPSSPGTVLTVAGLFVVAITLVLSGIIVLCRQSEQAFRLCGGLFVGIGVVMLLACALLQRKNIVKFVQDLNQDLYFLNMSDSYMWKLMFVNRSELPEPHDDSHFPHKVGLQPTEEKEAHEEVFIEMSNEGLGMRIDENLKVIDIAKNGPCDGKLLRGDHIIQIGDRRVQTIEEAKEAIESSSPKVRIVFDRGLQSTAQDNIPEQCERLFKRREGFTYHYVQINYVKGCKFGLGIKHFQNNVLVSRIDPGSLAAQSLQEFDHIIDIDGIRVTDKEIARSLLVRSLKKKNCVCMCVERPASPEAKSWVENAMTASQMQPPSVAMASDVREIAARQQQKMMTAMESNKPGIMRRPGSSGTGSDRVKAVRIAPAERQDVIIASDNEGKQLRHVKDS